MSSPKELSISVGNKSILIEGDLPKVDSDNCYVDRAAYDELALAYSNVELDHEMLKIKADKLAEALDDLISGHDLDCDCWHHQALKEYYEGEK